MQELDCSTIDNLWPNETKVTEVDKMKQEIASQFPLHYFHSTFADKCFTCCWQSAVTNVAAINNASLVTKNSTTFQDQAYFAGFSRFLYSIDYLLYATHAVVIHFAIVPRLCPLDLVFLFISLLGTLSLP